MLGHTCCHQDAALGINNPFTQRLRGEPCKLDMQGEKQGEAVVEVFALKNNISF